MIPPYLQPFLHAFRAFENTWGHSPTLTEMARWPKPAGAARSVQWRRIRELTRFGLMVRDGKPMTSQLWHSVEFYRSRWASSRWPGEPERKCLLPKEAWPFQGDGVTRAYTLPGRRVHVFEF